VLLAAGLALAAAVLHASWNIAVKQTGDRFLALWGQFVFSGAIATAILIVWSFVDGVPDIAWWWSIFSGCGHLPYVMLLARAYDKNDFSVTYPIARGAGALSAAILGLIFLGDDLSGLSMGGIAIVIFGLWILVSNQKINNISPALGVALTIGGYSVADAYGARNSNSIAFALSVFASGAITISTWAFITRRRQLKTFIKAHLKTSCPGGLCGNIARVKRGYRGTCRLEVSKRRRSQTTANFSRSCRRRTRCVGCRTLKVNYFFGCSLGSI
jgi:multidrug transporter EmrE-like cation transporter